MIALPPVDPADFIMQAGDEMQKCINKYFNEISLEDAIRAEPLDPKYAPDLLDRLQAEYYGKLERIWDTIPRYYRSAFKAAYQAPPLEVAGDMDALQAAYQAAVKRTLWEKLGRNYKDVTAYKLLLKQYGEALLWAMHSRFVDAASKNR